MFPEVIYENLIHNRKFYLLNTFTEESLALIESAQRKLFRDFFFLYFNAENIFQTLKDFVLRIKNMFLYAHYLTMLMLK